MKNTFTKGIFIILFITIGFLIIMVLKKPKIEIIERDVIKREIIKEEINIGLSGIIASAEEIKETKHEIMEKWGKRID